MVFHAPQHIALYVTWNVAAVVSVVCYCWLLFALRRNLAAVAQERLFPRQLRSLAMSGMLLHISSLPLIWTSVDDLEDGSWILQLRCAMFLLLRVSGYWTVFQETHMVLTFLTQLMHWTTSLVMLNRSIRVMWMLGIFMALIDPHSYTCGSKGPDFFVGGSTSLCLTTSVISGSSMLCVILRGKLPGRANQNFIRAAVYALIAPTSYSMMVAANFQPRLFHSPGWYFPLASTLKFSNGWLNTLAYALQSRYASRLLGQYDPQCATSTHVHGDVRDVASFTVAFGGVDIEDVLPWECTAAQAGQAGLVVPCSSSSELVSGHSSRSNRTSRAPETVVFFEELYNY